MNHSERFDAMWNDYLEGELDEAGLAELQQLLTSDDRFLKAAADSYRTHRLLGLNAQESETRHEDFVRATMAMLPGDEVEFVGDVMRRLPESISEPKRSNRFVSYSMVAGVAVLLLVAVYSFMSRRMERQSIPQIARVTGLSGPIQWTGEGGRVDAITQAGRSIAGGTLESLSANAWAELQFHDGSTVTVSGRSLLTVSEQEQKVVHLRYGNVSADVRPQPAEHPMLLHTPSAELKVLGTQFNVAARPETTSLTVNEGSVRFKRLTDGESIDVTADHVAIASLESQNGLTAAPKSPGVSTWQSDLERDVIYGKWISSVHLVAKQLKEAVAAGTLAKPDAIKRYKEAVTLDDHGSVWALPSAVGTLLSLRVSGWSTVPVIIESQSQFRIRGKYYGGGEVMFGFTADAPQGGFAGKYGLVLTDEDLSNDGDKFDITLPIERFGAKATRFGKSSSGKLLRDFWIVMKEKKAKLELTHLELTVF